jgi:hypothetical protein
MFFFKYPKNSLLPEPWEDCGKGVKNCWSDTWGVNKSVSISIPLLLNSRPQGSSSTVLDQIRCELIDKRVSGETPGGIFTYSEKNQRFYSRRQKSNVVETRREWTSSFGRRSVYHSVCSILSISKTGPKYLITVLLSTWLRSCYRRSSTIISLYIEYESGLCKIRKTHRHNNWTGGPVLIMTFNCKDVCYKR